MKDINQSQESLKIYRIRKLLKKTCIRTNQGIRDTYIINKKETKIIIKITKRENVLIN